MRALYIDFEGEKLKPPTLLGCANRPGRGPEPWVWQAVTDPLFLPLAKADKIELLDLCGAVERVLQRAERRDRLIVAWSEHELNVVSRYCPDKLDRFEARFVNARAFAVRWRNRCYGGEKPDSNSLADYLALIEHKVPQEAGPGRAAETIRILRKALEKGRAIDEITAIQRRRWASLRLHNDHDCAGMRRVCIRAASEIETASSRMSETTSDGRRPARRGRRHRTASLSLVGVR